jgi:hypothetical protein
LNHYPPDLHLSSWGYRCDFCTQSSLHFSMYWGLNSGPCARYSATWAIAFLLLGCFWDRVSCVCLGQPGLSFSYLWFSGQRRSQAHATMEYWLVKMGVGCVSLTFCLVWPQTAIFLISASWVTRIIGAKHHSWAAQWFLKSATTRSSGRLC